MINEIKENFVISKFTDVDILVIDDFGKQRNTEWTDEQLNFKNLTFRSGVFCWSLLFLYLYKKSKIC